MEFARETEYQRRSKLLKRICREYNLTEGSISEKLLRSDILINHQLNVCISIHIAILNKIEKPFSLMGCAKYDKIDRGCPIVVVATYARAADTAGR